MSALWLFLLVLAVVLLWQNHFRAQELADRIARNTCAVQNVQFLDGTVSLLSFRLRRQSGRFVIRRHFQFYYSEEGMNRREGFIIITGNQIESVGLAATDD
ncbi:MAG: hypothetical protein BMS9Abin26_1655 [Gammaproteobacteria bacterium]|nr:MAG: hypothetical protein BMS9Abin26_1655 [Gammaproteobacteria bacterium]